MNFSSAWTKLQQRAVNKDWISERVAIPKLTSRGHKIKTRPAFSREEIDKLFAYMESWAKQGRLEVEREIRPLVRDYVEMLLLTGMRHGTGALNICWKNIEWHANDGKKYLRIWVDGKTGGRWFANLAQQLMLIQLLIQEALILKLVCRRFVPVVTLVIICRNGMALHVPTAI